MILTRFTLTWPPHKNLPVFKRCFFNLLALKTGSKIIALVWILLLAVLFFITLRVEWNINTDEQFKIRCLFNQTSEPSCPVTGDSDTGTIFLYGYYNIIVNTTQGFVTSLTKIDDGYYEWGIFCTCLYYTTLILFCVLLYLGIILNKSALVLSWVGAIQMVLALEVCEAVYDFVFLVKNDQYIETLAFWFLVHIGIVGYSIYSLLIINSFLVSCRDANDNGNGISMIG